AQMGRVWPMAQRVDDQDVGAAHHLERGRGDGLRVGDVDERAEAEAVYQPAAVPDRNRLDTMPEQGESSGKLVERQVGLPPVERELVDEGIGEALAQGGGGVDVRVDRQ